MLKSLFINNYAIINEAEIVFSDKLNMITGETGAGKSILLGALGLLTGNRADMKVLFHVDKKCIIEGIFSIEENRMKAFFEEADIDFDKETVIRRELSESGKSRAFINDTPVSLQTLQKLSGLLITIHSQHETLELSDSKFQLSVIDSLANTTLLSAEFGQLYAQHKSKKEALKTLIEQTEKAISEKDFFLFQLNELSVANLDSINQELLESELEELSHAHEIKQAIITSLNQIQNEEINAIDLLNHATIQLSHVSKFRNDLKEQIDRYLSTIIELKDISRDLENKLSTVSINPARAEEIQQQLTSLFQLYKKHHCKHLQELIEKRNQYENLINHFSIQEDKINALEFEKNQIFKMLVEAAKNLSKKRASIFPSFETDLSQLLKNIGMKDAQLKVEHHFDLEKNLNHTGADYIQFLFSANKGSQLQDIKKVASGGELSRLMLCIKSLYAKSISLPTLIFDEIDSGVSGEVAHKVGNLLQSLSKNHQIIVITHLPQIAGKGNHHFLVYKETFKEKTQTKFKLLSTPERQQEIAKMLSGENPSKAAMEAAAELLRS